MIDILIPFKKISVRCPNKNFELFPYVINSLAEYKNNIVVLSEDQECIEFAKNFNIKTWKYDSKYSSDMNICYQYAQEHHLEHFFMFPLTQPFKDLQFINIAQNLTEYDMVCSSVMTADRRLFYRNNDNFVIPDSERKGCLCKEYEMIDGSMYFVKTSFLQSCIVNNEIDNYLFWNSSKLKSVICNHPFFDIDTKADMEQFKFIINYTHK